MRWIGVDWDVLREYLIYWGFIPSPIPPKHSNPKVSKLSLKGEEVRSDTPLLKFQLLPEELLAPSSFLNLRFETAAIGHSGTKLQYRQLPWRGKRHWFYLPHEGSFVLFSIHINLNFKQTKIFYNFFNLFQFIWDRSNKTWIGREAQSRMFWPAITTSSWGDRTVLLNTIDLVVRRIWV
jgi:hypothetical protein